MNTTDLITERRQLIARIAEIDALLAANTNTGYAITETTETRYGTERTVYHITRDGRPWHGETLDRDVAEQLLKGWQHIPDGYFLSYASRGREGWGFQVRTGATKGSWKQWATDIDKVIRWANEHLAAAPAREARAAERAVQAEMDAIAAAEAARVAAERELLATPRQVEFILNLLAQRKLSGEGGGFFIGPEDREGIEKLTKIDASAYITSLKGEY